MKSSKTLSYLFEVGEYFEVVKGPFKGTKGKITRIDFDNGTFSYEDCKTGKELLLLSYYIEEKGFAEKRRGCE